MLCPSPTYKSHFLFKFKNNLQKYKEMVILSFKPYLLVHNFRFLGMHAFFIFQSDQLGIKTARK